MTKKQKAKRIAFGGIAIILISISCIIWAYLSGNGFEYTKEYKVYNDIKDNSSLDELTEELKKSKLEYTIAGDKLTLKEYENISFSINNNGDCYADNNKIMNNFEMLDAEDRSIVTIEGELVGDKICEKVTISQEQTSYTKQNNKYFVLYEGFLALIPMFGIPISFLLAICALDGVFKKKDKNSKKENKDEPIFVEYTSNS